MVPGCDNRTALVCGIAPGDVRRGKHVTISINGSSGISMTSGQLCLRALSSNQPLSESLLRGQRTAATRMRKLSTHVLAVSQQCFTLWSRSGSLWISNRLYSRADLLTGMD